MNQEFLKKYLESMNWVNPESRLRTKLGEHIGNGRFVNFTHKDLEFELSLLDNPRNEKMIGAGQDGNVFLHSQNNKHRAVKVYRTQSYSCPIGTGISQLRASRKIKQLGYETPEVFAATENVLVMEYIPYESLQSYIHKQNNEDKIYLHSKWLNMMETMWRQIGKERIDKALVNGYIRPGIHSFDLGMIDQG